MISFEKVKVTIEVSIYAIGGIAEGTTAHVQWTRGKNSIQSKKQTIENKVAKFTDKFKLNSTLQINDMKAIRPDLNTLAVVIDGVEIGVVRFDMGNFYGVKPELIRAVIGAKRTTDDSSTLIIESDSP